MLEKAKDFLFKNEGTRQTVAKNSFWLTVTNFGGRLIKAVLVIYAARVLGTAEYGVFSYAVTLAAFVGVFLDPGINSILTRDSAKVSEEERRTLFSTTFAIKLALIAAGVVVIIFIGPYFSTLPGAKVLLPIVAILIAFDTIREFLSSLIRSREKMEWETGIFIFTNLAIVVSGFLFLFASPTAKSLAWGYATGTALGAILAIIILRKDIKQAFSHFSAILVRPVIASAWPFAVTGAMGLLFTNTDILIISWMKTASDVGIYSAAIRIIQVLYLVPGVLQLSTLPLFSRLAKHDDKKMRIALEGTVGLIFLLSIPMAIGGVLLGTQIMTLIFGASFAGGGLSFKLLALTLIVDYPGSLIVNAIFAYGHQKSLINTAAVGAITNVVFDLLLIPRFGITGSAVATLIAQIAGNAYLWHVMRKINYFEIMPRLGKIIMASAAMGIVTLALFLLNFNVALNVVASTTTYALALWLLKEPMLTEIGNIISVGTPT
jgi:O-antigen/teichoic acid export membrane protein